jgi:UDP-N-acetylglucosamine 2-epimerase
MTKLRPLFIFGTRPEAIKMAPLLRECSCRGDRIDARVCLTGQHREMLAQVTDYFGIAADEVLQVMTPNQSLAELTARCMERLDDVVLRAGPDQIVVQGDTTSSMTAALVAFYRRVPLVHVEAGLRTGNLQSPWPEELNRRVTGMIAALHCAPTQRAADALLAEGCAPQTVHVTGNTVIDALLETLRRERHNGRTWAQRHAAIGGRRMVLITGHRRESFGRGFRDICQAIAELARRFHDCEFVYPVHLNPQVQEPVRQMLASHSNIHLLDPVPYPEFVWLMDRSTVILTDSGGVQEEAPSLGRPVVVMRETTERPEAVEAGAVRLAGTSPAAIVEAVSTLLTDPAAYAACLLARNPYGDGQAARRIVHLMLG